MLLFLKINQIIYEKKITSIACKHIYLKYYVTKKLIN